MWYMPLTESSVTAAAVNSTNAAVWSGRPRLRAIVQPPHTNAAGAATFKYGATRQWVQALTVVLADGDVLDIERGQTRAHPDGYFDLELSNRTARVPVPRYEMPPVSKLAAGYFAEPGMDLVDLFVGSEGTLGVVTSVTLRVLPMRPATCLALVPFRDQTKALTLAGRLRAAPIEHPSIPRRVVIATNMARPATPAAAAVVDLVIEVIRGLVDSGAWPARWVGPPS